jgi:hypothetical protein
MACWQRRVARSWWKKHEPVTSPVPRRAACQPFVPMLLALQATSYHTDLLDGRVLGTAAALALDLVIAAVDILVSGQQGSLADVG